MIVITRILNLSLIQYFVFTSNIRGCIGFNKPTFIDHRVSRERIDRLVRYKTWYFWQEFSTVLLYCVAKVIGNWLHRIRNGHDTTIALYHAHHFISLFVSIPFENCPPFSYWCKNTLIFTIPYINSDIYYFDFLIQFYTNNFWRSLEIRICNRKEVIFYKKIKF